MSFFPPKHWNADSPRWRWLVILCAAVVALVSARDYAGGWNDGSRLATVECLVDHGTWAIDRSVFVTVPPALTPDEPRPYAADDVPSLRDGTQDKLFINGHFYSDKSPVPALLLAGEYAVLRAVTGWTARTHPDHFCWWLTLGSVGLAYVVAVGSMDRLGRSLRLGPALHLTMTATFALTTIALTYARQVNNHVLLLAVTATLLAELMRCRAEKVSWGRWLSIGTWAGLAYTIDLGAGPVIALGAAGMAAYRGRFRGLAVFAVAALPWLLLHHGLNYAIGGTLGPANAYLPYLLWPGSPFTAANSTGGWQHPSMLVFVLYAVDLLVGKKGFLTYNLALYLAVPGVVRLLWRRTRELPELLLCVFWCAGVWLLYSAASTNASGACCSVRWFVPLLAPGYFILAVLLREIPEYRRDFAVLSAWAAGMSALLWLRGPWALHILSTWWAFLAGAGMSWAVVRWRSQRQPREPNTIETLRQAA